MISPYDPTAPDFSQPPLSPPSATHLLGTDNFGRDVLTRLAYGGRVDLVVAFVATAGTVIVGGFLGLVAGYTGGWLDTLIMRLVDFTLTIPYLILVIAIVAILGPGTTNIIYAIWIVGWVAYARIVRSETLVVRRLEYVDAARVLGMSDLRVMLRHILPNVSAAALVYSMGDMVLNILLASSLSFLGLGTIPPNPEWGLMVAEAARLLPARLAPHDLPRPGRAHHRRRPRPDRRRPGPGAATEGLVECHLSLSAPLARSAESRYDCYCKLRNMISQCEIQTRSGHEQVSADICVHVALDGDDSWPGTEDSPVRTLHAARDLARQIRWGPPSPITILVHGGTYELFAPLTLTAHDSGAESATVTYLAEPGKMVTISGGQRLDCHWQPYRDGIMMCRLPADQRWLKFSQLFVDGKRQTLARYPNRDDSAPKSYSGYVLAAGKIEDDVPDPRPGPNDDMVFSGGAPRGIAYDPATFTDKEWSRPDEAVIHIFQSHSWGNLQWRLKDVDRDNHRLWFGHGGQQMGAKWAAAPCEVNHRSHFFVENVFEELDAPGEWYYDQREGILYFMPPADLDLDTAVFDVPMLQQLVRLTGTSDDPVQHVTFEGFRFALTASTFLEPYAVPSLSDWAIHRGGTIFLDGARDCTFRDCFFDAVGGNAIFASGYNRDITVTGCRITEAGDSAICFVGSLETTVGTQRNFPYQCRVTNNLIHDCGVFGKQTRRGLHLARQTDQRRSQRDLSPAARGDLHWRRHLGWAPYRVQRHARHLPRNRRPRPLQRLGPRQVLVSRPIAHALHRAAQPRRRRRSCRRHGAGADPAQLLPRERGLGHRPR